MSTYLDIIICWFLYYKTGQNIIIPHPSERTVYLHQHCYPIVYTIPQMNNVYDLNKSNFFWIDLI
jgi:hypothetical protein